MTKNISTETLDCRGQRCPAPILALSKRARAMGETGGLLEIRADDPAFSLDLESWCRSAKAEVLHLDDDGEGKRALVRVPSKRRGPSPKPRPHVMPDPVAVEFEAARVPKVAPPPPAPQAENPQTASPEIVVDLRALPARVWDTVLDGAREELGEGELLRVVGAGAECSSRIVGWCAKRGHELVTFQTDGLVTAEIRLRGDMGDTAAGTDVAPAAETTALAPAKPGCTLLVLHNDHEALLAAMLVAVGAASQGKEVVVFFTFWGLNLLRGDAPNAAVPKQRVSMMQKMMKMMMPKGPNKQSLGQMNFGGAGKAMLGSIMRKQNIMSLPELMATAEEQGVRFIACTMSMEVMGITKRDLQPRDNLEYGGVAAFVDNAHGAGMSLVF